MYSTTTIYDHLTSHVFGLSCFLIGFSYHLQHMQDFTETSWAGYKERVFKLHGIYLGHLSNY